LLSDPENLAKWNGRPPSAETKEFFRFFGEKLPAGIGYTEAGALERQRYQELRKAEDARLDDWSAYSRLLENLADRDFREDYGIKKPSMTLVRKVAAKLIAEGWTYKRIEDDEDEFIDHLIEADPKIEKQ